MLMKPIQEDGVYILPPLPYSYDSLEPYMDARTVEIHYTKHHQGYVNKLNAALKEYPELQKMPLEELIIHLDKVPEKIRTAVRHNGGGHFNHMFFWNTMSSDKKDESPADDLKKAIIRDFGSLEEFKKKFAEQAGAFFGSGWTWLVMDSFGKLHIVSTPGHDVPMREGFQPILIIDVWEHAYYLKYQNRRPEFIENWWHLVNWPVVNSYFDRAKLKLELN